MFKISLLLKLSFFFISCENIKEPDKNPDKQLIEKHDTHQIKKNSIVNKIIIKDNPLEVKENKHVPEIEFNSLYSNYKEVRFKQSDLKDTFCFKPKFTKDHVRIRKIPVYLGDSLIQTLNYNGVYYSIELLDWNFDGHKDISILESVGATGNYFYNIFIYQPEKHTFQKFKGFETWNGFVDVKNQMLVKHYRTGIDHESFEYFKVKNGLPVLDHGKNIDLIRRDKSGNYVFKVTRSKMINNKLFKNITFEKNRI